jgi:hypothetical protein
MQKAGISLDEINAFLDTDFSELTPPEPQPVNNGQQGKKSGGRNGKTVEANAGAVEAN